MELRGSRYRFDWPVAAGRWPTRLAALAALAVIARSGDIPAHSHALADAACSAPV